MGKTLLATIDTFTKRGRFVPRGAPLDSSEVDYEEGKSENLTEAPDGIEDGAAVQISAIAPVGPNPTAPQQISPGTVQTEAGYFDRGAKLVGEVTKPADQRFVQIVDDESTIQGDVQQALDDHAQGQGDRRAAASGEAEAAATDTGGTVTDVTAQVADADAATLDQLEAAENGRDKPRKGVLNAIEARRAQL